MDPEVEARILEGLRTGETDSTLVVVAYRKATIGLADEVLHLEDGRIADRGTHAELLSRSPAYANLVNAYEQAADDAKAAKLARGGPGMTLMDTGEDIAAIETIRRGVHFSPELKEGIGGTLGLAVLASVGQVIVPIAVQQTLDRGINGSGGPDVSYTVLMGVLAAFAVVLTSWASYAMTSRLFTTSERGLATLRIKAFRHVHDLPLLTQNTERRGALVSRVTSDVDQVSQFLVFGGLIFVISVGQVLIATVVMVFYSWQLAIVVWVCFAPLFLSLRFFQRKLSDAYGTVRRQIGLMLSAISEPVVGAAVVRSYAVEDRTQARIDEAIKEFQSASTRAQGFTAFSFSLGGISAGLANAGVLIVGIWLGFAGDITSGEVIAFAFLVTLFVGPVQMGTQILTDAQNAIAGWRRVIGILETPADLVDPGPDGEVLPRGPIDVRIEDVEFAYPGGPPVLHDVTMDIAAGQTGGDRGGDGIGQVDLRQAAHPADGPRLRSRAARRHRRTPDPAVLAAPQRRAGAAGGLPLRRQHRRQRPLRKARRDRGRHPGQRRRARSRRLGGGAARPGWTPRSASAASRCRPASASWSRCCARTSPTRTCWCSTRPPAPSTPRWRCGSTWPSSG